MQSHMISFRSITLPIQCDTSSGIMLTDMIRVRSKLSSIMFSCKLWEITSLSWSSSSFNNCKSVPSTVVFESVHSAGEKNIVCWRADFNSTAWWSWKPLSSYVCGDREGVCYYWVQPHANPSLNVINGLRRRAPTLVVVHFTPTIRYTNEILFSMCGFFLAMRKCFFWCTVECTFFKLGSRHKLHPASSTLADQELWNESTHIVLQLKSQFNGNRPQAKTVKSICRKCRILEGGVEGRQGEFQSPGWTV